LNNLKTNFLKFNENNELDLKKKYEAKLFKRNKSATFINSKGTLFQGKIKGINELGKLIILLEKGILKEFDLKEITLLY
jgi:BirA family biotin operon repressor/biotin-[acetyl-CoA-carboxylase] ligase